MKLTLETERLLLRPFRIEDAKEMFFGWANDPEVTKYLTWNPHESVAETEALLAKWVAEYEKPERLNFAIVLKEENKLIGGIDVVGYLNGPTGTPVIGYCIGRPYWNRGVMTEACSCLLDYLFGKGYTEVRIDALTENTGSNRVIQKCGGQFLYEDTEDWPQKDAVVHVNRYAVRRPADLPEQI